MVDLVQDGELKILLAPTGSGKTHFILNRLNCGLRRIVFVSPLKALAMEFYEKTHGRSLLVCSSLKQEQLDEEWRFLVATPEALGNRWLEKLSVLEPKPLIILDEIHLFYKWGKSFRPRLLSFIESIGVFNFPSLGLTATLDQSSIQWVKNSISSGFETSLMDHGNMEMKFPPSRNYFFPRKIKKIFEQFFEDQMRFSPGKTALYFCRTRNEVFQWVDYFHWLGVPSLGCVGGQTQNFMKNYNKNDPPRVIFSTSALSHGVNLGLIDEIYIGYLLKNEDMWIQMASRGGRSGESFNIYSFNSWGKEPQSALGITMLLKIIRSRLIAFFKV